MSTLRRRILVATGVVLVLAADPARADEPSGGDSSVSGTIDLTKDTSAKAQADLTAPAPEAPPPAPYKKTLVLDSSIGAMGFLGQFGKLAPWGPWLHTQLGYELLSWFMLFGEGDLAFTDTSNKVRAPELRAFPMFGFGGGARFTARFTDRFGAYAQGSIGAFKADVGTNALGLFGFRNAETLGVYLGARLGIEWYQLDRHLALGLNAGIRTPQGFAKTGGAKDTPLALDGGLALRYAF